MRILICLHCESMENLTDYEGPRGYDAELDYLVGRHQERHPHALNSGQLLQIPDKQWDDPKLREEILKQIKGGLGQAGTGEGLGQKTYDLIDTFKDDALMCFDKHHRNPACPDYHSPEKRLTPGTSADRKELGLDTKYDQNPALTKYLCDYCPVKSLVDQAAQERAGL